MLAFEFCKQYDLRMQWSVLTGDIVNSSALTRQALDKGMDALRHAAGRVSTWPTAPHVSFSRRGGDSWQIALAAPNLSLRAALYLMARLRRDCPDLSSRVAVATGAGVLPSSGNTNAAHGPAFTSSGRLLDSLARGQLLAHADGGARASCFALADAIAQSWTSKQARALCEILPGTKPTRAEIAAALGITRQAVDQALAGAHYAAIDRALSAFEHEASK